MHRITVDRVAAPTGDVRLLVGELDAFLAALYTPEQRHGLTLDAIFQPHIRFFVARLEGQPAGCGGVALFPDFAEVKRMYVRESLRGRGVAQALLGRIEQAALEAGQTLLRLESGVHQPDALRLFSRWGFQNRGAFGDYAAMTPEAIVASVFMEKRIGTHGTG